MLRGQNAYWERAACPFYTAIAVIEGRRRPMVFQRLLEKTGMAGPEDDRVKFASTVKVKPGKRPFFAA
jgi:hypothetical protein